MSKTYAVLLAGGRGARLPGMVPKQFLTIAGRTVLEWSLSAFLPHQEIDAVILVSRPEYRKETEAIVKKLAGAKDLRIVDGGESRQESSARGIDAIPDEDAVVLIHDVARPLVPRIVIDACLAALDEHDAVLTAVKPIDTLFAASSEDPEMHAGTLNRARLRLAQTPQGFKIGVIRSAHCLAAAEGDFSFSDDAGMVAHYGLAAVAVVPGALENVKITHPQDVAVAEALLRHFSDALQH